MEGRGRSGQRRWEDGGDARPLGSGNSKQFGFTECEEQGEELRLVRWARLSTMDII